MAESLQAACEAKILEHAGPFTEISEAGRAHLASWLAAVPAGQTKSRLELVEGNASIRSDLMSKLAFEGALAALHGLGRIVWQSMMDQKPSFRLEVVDLEWARRPVSASITILCPSSDD